MKQAYQRNMDAIKAELIRISEASPDKILRAADVVQAAKDENSILHNHFDWDDAVAAQQWRLVQARFLIRSVKVEYIEADQPKMIVPVFVSPKTIRQNPEGGYRLLEYALQNDEERTSLFDEIIAELEYLRNKSRNFKELSALWSELDAVLATHKLSKVVKPVIVTYTNDLPVS